MDDDGNVIARPHHQQQTQQRDATGEVIMDPAETATGNISPGSMRMSRGLEV